MTAPHLPPRAVVAGHGSVGRLLSELLCSAGWETVALDAHADADGPDAHADAPAPDARADAPTPEGTARPLVLRTDIASPTPEARARLAAADAVFIALPERAALSAVDVLASGTGPSTTLVETLSHKARFLDAAEQRLAPRPVLSLNPLFHPSLGWAGNTVTASSVREDVTAGRVLDLIGAAGARVHRLDHATHDRCVTAVQAATHAAVLGFAGALARLELPAADVAACAAPPTRTLMALAARILSAQAETYWDIQDSGAEAAEARAALRSAGADLESLVRDGDDGGFHELFDRLRGWFGDGLDGSAGDAARLFHTYTAAGAAPSAAARPNTPSTPGSSQ